MARGLPDSGITSALYASQVVDPSYTANMLWGFSPIDSQGRVLYLDTFNNGLGGFRLYNQGAGLIPAIVDPVVDTSFAAYSPPYAVKLNPGTVSNDRSFMAREMFAGRATRLGLEAGVWMNDVCGNFRITIDYKPIGGNPYQAILQYTRPNFQIWTPSGFQTISTMSIPGATGFNIQVKFVGDWSTGKYVRAFIADQSFDLSSYSIAASVSSLTGFLTSNFLALSYGVGTTSVFLGYYLLTKDEA